jgi:GNAT superfamily N-acetyltransferase
MNKIEKVQTKQQIEQVVCLAKTIWEKHYTPIIGEKQVTYMLDNFQSVVAIEQQIVEGYQYYLIKDTEYLGYLGIVIEEGIIFLSKLYLLEEARGKGIGREAINYVETIARDNKITKIYLTCNKHNISSLQVYKRLGFACVRTEESNIGEGYIMDDYVLEKKVV